MQLQHIFGFHAISSRIKRHPSTVQEIYLDESKRDPRIQSIIALAKQHNIRVISVNAERLDGMTGNARHQGAVARVEQLALHRDLDELLDTLEVPPLLLVL